jgi:hypothetical protein
MVHHQMAFQMNHHQMQVLEYPCLYLVFGLLDPVLGQEMPQKPDYLI